MNKWSGRLDYFHHPIRTADRKPNEKKTTRNNTRDVWASIKHANVHMIGIPEGGEKEKGIENAF